MKNLVILIFCLGFSFQVLSQKNIQKFKKVSLDELQMKIYEKDSLASAVILYEKGTATFELNKYSHTRHIKLKILNKAGLKYANFEVLLREINHLKERIYSVKGTTYNIVNEEIHATNFNTQNIYTKKISDSYSLTTIPMPSAKVGSVIDLEYHVVSPFSKKIDSWVFQKDIPVQYSEFSCFVPEFLDYNVIQNGVDKVNIQLEKDQRSKLYSIPIRGGYYKKHTWEIIYTWVAIDVPSFTIEEYSTTMQNFVNQLTFEIAGYKIEGVYYDLANTWDQIYKDILKTESYGKKPSRKIKKIAATIEGEMKTLEAAKNTYQYVANNIRWNNYYSMYISKKSSEIINNRSGNSADINITLIKLLKAKGFTVTPIILSTRKNGRIYYPTRFKFNYVIAQLELDNQIYFLDATEELIPFGMLPKRCLNGSAHKISSKESGKIDIQYTNKKITKKIISFTLDKDEILGKGIEKIEGYAAYDLRKKIKKIGKKQYLQEQSDNCSEYKFDNLFEDLSENITINYDINNDKDIRKTKNTIYLTPLLNYNLKINPFVSENRNYPVDFAYPRSETVVITFSIPENYEIDAIPEIITMKLPNNIATYSFNIKKIGSKLNIIRRFSINQTSFIGEDYLLLKKFYNLIIEKEKESIILKLIK